MVGKSRNIRLKFKSPGRCSTRTATELREGEQNGKIKGDFKFRKRDGVERAADVHWKTIRATNVEH